MKSTTTSMEGTVDDTTQSEEGESSSELFPDENSARDSLIQKFNDSTIASESIRSSEHSDEKTSHYAFKGDFPTDITEKYILMKDVLGEGSFGTVRKCRNRRTRLVCALKTIDKSKLPDATQLRREVDILLHVHHPHIIRLYDVYEDDTNIYLVSELCSGGELYDRVVEKMRSKEGHFSEYTAARIIQNILSAISYCHDVKKIVHRDLKPENFLLTDKTDNAQVKVIDFGLSRYSNDRMKTQCGTIYYVAPEVLFGEYTDKADIWSIGVVAYVLLCGFPPFNAGTEGLTYDMVKEGRVHFPSPAWDKISQPAIEFVKRLLDRDPNQRPKASEALQDPWITHKMVNPFRRMWHGTFLHKDSEQAKSVPRHMTVEHHDGEKQKAYEHHRQQKKAKKKKTRRSGGRKKQNSGSLKSWNLFGSVTRGSTATTTTSGGDSSLEMATDDLPEARVECTAGTCGD